VGDEQLERVRAEEDDGEGDEGEARRLVEDVGMARAAVGDHREPEPEQRIERRLVVGDADEPAEHGHAGRRM